MSLIRRFNSGPGATPPVAGAVLAEHTPIAPADNVPVSPERVAESRPARRERGATRPDGKAIDLFQEMTDAAVTSMEEGGLPWRPSAPGAAVAWPQNGTTGRLYHGINVPMLMSKGMPDDRWATFKQAKAEGWNVRRGERGSRIYFHVMSERPTGDMDEQGEPLMRKIPHLRSFTVFNFSQIEGASARDDRAPGFNDLVAGRVDDMVAAMGVDPEYLASTVGARGPINDAYYEAVLYRAVLWTGHPDRMNRAFARDPAAAEYVREELRADIATAMLCTRLGIEVTPGVSTARAERFMLALKADRKEIYRASRDAEQIVTHMLAHHPEYRDGLREEAKAMAEDAKEAGFPDEYIEICADDFDFEAPMFDAPGMGP